MSFFSGLAGVLLPTFTAPFLLIKPLISLLTPKTPRPPPAAQQVYDVSAQQNVPRIGDVQAVVYGQVRRYPALCSQAWTEFADNDQVLHQWMRVSVGIAQLLDLAIGKTPLTSFPGTQVQVCLPGERMTIFHPNVFTNGQVSSIDIASGALLNRIFSGTLTLGGASTPSRVDGGSGAFDGARVGYLLTLAGTTADDGIYTISAVGGSSSSWVEVSGHTFTDETVAATATFQYFDLRNNDAKQAQDANLSFDPTLSTITVTPTDDNPNTFSVFAVGDQISPLDGGAGANQNQVFNVLAVSGDGNSLVVTPAPATAAGISTVVLLRRYIGPFDVCPQGDQASDVAFDFVFPEGIGDIDTKKGSIAAITIRFDPQWRAVDDAGNPLGSWTSFGELAIKAVSRAPYRTSVIYALPAPARVQLRLALTSKDQTGSDILDHAQWVGARGFIVNKPGEEAAIDHDSTTLAVTIRANGTLAQGDNLKINCLVQRWLETWDPVTQAWGPEQPTRSIVWAVLDKLRGRYTCNGRAIEDGKIDLAAFAALDAELAAEGLTFDGTIEAQDTLLGNANTILGLARAQLVYDAVAGQFRPYRDIPGEPLQLFCDLNSLLSDYQLSLQTDNDPTGVLAQYMDPVAYEERDVGIGDTDTKPQTLDLRNGCTTRQTAWALANFAWNGQRYRNRKFSLDAELEPILLGRGARVLVQSRLRGWGQAAEVVAVDGTVLTVEPPPVWTAASGSVILRGPDGAPAAPIAAMPGASAAQIQLASAPNVEITGASGAEIRSLLVLSQAGDEPVVAIVDSAQWKLGDAGGAQATLACSVDDARVYADPGEAPPDPYAISVVQPALAIAALTLSAAAGIVSAAWTTVPDVLIYELDWHYAGTLSWTTVTRTTATGGSFAVPTAGIVEARVRAYGPGGTIGDYTVTPLTVTVGTDGVGLLVASLSPTTLSRAGSTPVVTSASCSASATGGVPPYAYSWTQLSGGAISATDPGAATTAFTASALAPGETRTGLFHCTVTDTANVAAASGAVTVTLVNDYTGS